MAKEKSLFYPMNSVVSIILITILFKVSVPFIQWLLIDSVWSGTAADCRQAEGACLAFIREKSTFILFGFYPRELLWRPITTVILFIAMVWYSKEPKRWNSRLLWRWAKFLLLAALLMRGGMFGFEAVEIEKWGGLPLTLMLAFFGIIFSYPMGILLALGRRSHMPIIKSSCVIYIELIRGVPLISLLFMASVMMPFFLPA
ncbi:ABC transporter permease subunit [Bacteriovoracaceae bacterium]|nr:ABC transporter permease subunit [Bacteriovoracaceae bacterium]